MVIWFLLQECVSPLPVGAQSVPGISEKTVQNELLIYDLIKILFDKTLFIASTKETLPNRLVGYSVISLAVHVPSKIPYWFLISPVFNFAFFAIVKKHNEIKEPRT